ncbi:MAG TPA: DUF6265 family protein [Candidatus Limnocylindria bacterium]|jgi:hypothetical protein|nr:DUF6265 family protein [Candidatus Limnocylindria bacterium]
MRPATIHPITPIPATARQLAWMSGRWVGEHDADRIEEIWTDPHAGMMLGMFRWHQDGAPRFYELLTLEPDGDRLIFRIKHFAPGLVGWEEKDQAVTLDLVSLREGEAVFLKRGEERWMVYQSQPDSGELWAWFDTGTDPHQAGDEFRYSRG